MLVDVLVMSSPSILFLFVPVVRKKNKKKNDDDEGKTTQ